MLEEKAAKTIFTLKNDRMAHRELKPTLFMLRKLSHLAGLPLVVFFWTGLPYPLWAEEQTSIQQILEEPRVYHLRHVTLQGTVRDVTPLDPYKLPNETICYGAYLFRLEDEAATIPVAVLGLCGKPVVRNPEVEDGDHVEVSATIQAPSHGGYYLSFQGLKVVTEQEGIVQAVADRILPIVE